MDEQKAMMVGSDPDGGYLVPTATSSRIITKVYETSPLDELAYHETITTDAIEIAIDTDEAGAGWVGETEARPETSTPQVGVQRIPVFEIYAKPKATQQLLEDAGVDIEAWLERKVADKFGRMRARRSSPATASRSRAAS
jgi:HK97 family phage major capsid protein